jgi:preprotein translocase subunit YajC
MQNTIVLILYIAFFIGLMYFLILRPQKKQQKKQQELMNSIENGDYIVTTSGFYGVVIDVTGDDVIVEFGNNKNCRIAMRKAAIEQVEKPASASAGE